MAKRRGHGEGSIYQRPDGSWSAQVNLGIIGGKRKRRTISGPTRKEVAEKLRALQREIERGATATNNETVEAYLTRWLADVVAQRVRPSTLNNYRTAVRVHLVPELGRIKLAKLGAQDVQAMVTRLQSRGVGARAIENAVNILGRALAVAERWALVSRNAARLASPPRAVAKPRGVLTPEQLQRLLATLDGTRYQLLIALAGVLGLRRGEALGLQWRDIDELAGTIAVRRAVLTLDGGAAVADLKTPASRRVLPIPDVLRPILAAHRALVLLEHGPLTPEQHVVLSSRGEVLSPSTVTNMWPRLLERADLARIPFHALRHTAATLMAEAGVPPHIARDLLGHTSITTTMEIYTHILDGAKEAAGAALDRLFSAAERPKAAHKAAERDAEGR